MFSKITILSLIKFNQAVLLAFITDNYSKLYTKKLNRMPFFTRRNFLRNSLIGGISLPLGFLGCTNSKQDLQDKKSQKKMIKPIILSTWSMGIKANEAAWEKINNTQNALDAVEAGVRITEADPNITSVGYGATPDRDGNITLDACIMDHLGNAGSVSYLQHILHPISVARKVMEETPHVMLTGEGALQFALEQGFDKMNLMTEDSTKRYEEWKKTANYNPEINVENHDTIGMIALDQNGNLSGACTTSGIGYKMAGRVGDSPVIGAGLFVDNEVGAATATGLGELVLKTLGTFLTVEFMRMGKSPQEACEAAIKRIMDKYPEAKNAQVGFIAINKNGEHGAFAIHDGFDFAIHTNESNTLIRSDFYLKN